MPSPPPKKEYVRLTLCQKAMLCKMASMQPGNMTTLAEWATRAFDLPRPPSQSVLYDGIVERPSSKMAMRRILSY
ncbi:hypothetical protein PI125_g17175 [Phytophthora idaei]|nr:hypothetical protein PI125_g17175 [Phytophthora idaei]